MLNNVIVQIGLVLAAAISAAGGIYAVIASKDKTEAETEQLSDSTLIQRLNALSKDFDRLQQLSNERFIKLIEIETLVTRHVSWDFQVVRECRRRGWDIEDPPSLEYVRQKLDEAKEKEIEQQHQHDGTSPLS